MSVRLPAEWEEQDGVLLAWPHENSDWHPILDQVEPVFIDIVRHISRYEKVLIVAPDQEEVSRKLQDVLNDKIRIYQLDTNDTWSRDFGPITVFYQGKPVLLDFGFNGWGLKFAANFDNQ